MSKCPKQKSLVFRIWSITNCFEFRISCFEFKNSMFCKNFNHSAHNLILKHLQVFSWVCNLALDGCGRGNGGGS